MSLPYFSQCDKFRTHYIEGEELWQEMMANKSPIVLGKVIEEIDASRLLDEDETLESLFHDHLDSDLSTQFYRSDMYGETVYFLQTAGFEFIFMPELLSSALTRIDVEPASPKL